MLRRTARKLPTCSPAEEGRDGDDGGGGPGGGGHEAAGAAPRQSVRVRVGDVARDEPVAVERDRGDVEDRRRAAEHVRRRPEVAQRSTDSPLAAYHLLYEMYSRVYSPRTVALIYNAAK